MSVEPSLLLVRYTTVMVHCGNGGEGREGGGGKAVMLLTWMAALKPGIAMEINDLEKPSDPYGPECQSWHQWLGTK